MEGLYQQWYSNGTQQCECNFVNGVLEGAYTYWYSDGSLQSECIFAKNQVIKGIRYDLNGEVYLSY